MNQSYRGYPLVHAETLEMQNAGRESGRPMERLERQEPKKLEQQDLERRRRERQENERRPYMIYNWEEQSGQNNPWDDRRRIQAEYEYFHGLYPLSARSWQRFVEEEMDRSDVPGNMMYDEYPDRENLYLMRDRIMRNAGEQGRMENQDMVLILMLHEILRRRQTKR